MAGCSPFPSAYRNLRVAKSQRFQKMLRSGVCSFTQFSPIPQPGRVLGVSLRSREALASSLQSVRVEDTLSAATDWKGIADRDFACYLERERNNSRDSKMFCATPSASSVLADVLFLFCFRFSALRFPGPGPPEVFLNSKEEPRTMSSPGPPYRQLLTVVAKSPP